MITAHSAVRGLGLGSAEIQHFSEAISSIYSLMLSSTSSSPIITESLELMQLETGKDKLVFEEKKSQCGTLVTPF